MKIGGCVSFIFSVCTSSGCSIFFFFLFFLFYISDSTRSEVGLGKKSSGVNVCFNETVKWNYFSGHENKIKNTMRINVEYNKRKKKQLMTVKPSVINNNNSFSFSNAFAVVTADPKYETVSGITTEYARWNCKSLASV